MCLTYSLCICWFEQLVISDGISMEGISMCFGFVLCLLGLLCLGLHQAKKYDFFQTYDGLERMGSCCFYTQLFNFYLGFRILKKEIFQSVK